MKLEKKVQGFENTADVKVEDGGEEEECCMPIAKGRRPLKTGVQIKEIDFIPSPHIVKENIQMFCRKRKISSHFNQKVL